MIKEKLDKYLEFDSNMLFIDKCVRVFGGAIRDSIFGYDIQDIDILVGSKSISKLEYLLDKNGYSKFKFMNIHSIDMYKDIHVISRPDTWIKNNKIVQLIRPAIKTNSEEIYQKSFVELIKNVDISCCGVSYDGEYIYENCKNAILHCESGHFMINEKAILYSSNRTNERKEKLISRGWTEIIDERDFKIFSILEKNKNFNNIKYLKEY